MCAHVCFHVGAHSCAIVHTQRLPCRLGSGQQDCLHFPGTRKTGRCCHTKLFTWVWGIEPGSPCAHNAKALLTEPSPGPPLCFLWLISIICLNYLFWNRKHLETQSSVISNPVIKRHGNSVCLQVWCD